MGRAKQYNERRVATAVRLPESLVDRLRAEADRREVSVNYLITRASDYYLSVLEASPVPDELAPRLSPAQP